MLNTADNTPELQKFMAYLNSRHLRKTPERFEILRKVLECNGHFDADILSHKLEETGYHVSKATIYSTLELLCASGLVRKLLFDTHQARYEMAEQTHTHLVCTMCGEIREVNLDIIDTCISAALFEGFSPAYVSTCIYGICDKCREKTDSRIKGDSRSAEQ